MIVRNCAAALDAALKVMFRELERRPAPDRILSMMDQFDSVDPAGDPGREPAAAPRKASRRPG